VLDGSEVVFQTRIMNEHLICSLCMGYLREAMTVTECLHTFCKPCIVQHFVENLACPTCEVNLGPTPLEKVRVDRAMQNIVDKVFPHFAKEEAAAEKHLQREATEANQRRSQAASQESETKRKKVVNDLQAKKKTKVKETEKEGAAQKLCLSLFPREGGERPLPKLAKPHLRSSPEATIKQYKNYLSGKLSSESNVTVAAADIEMSCKGAIVRNEATLSEVWKEHWNTTEDLQLCYDAKPKD